MELRQNEPRGDTWVEHDMMDGCGKVGCINLKDAAEIHTSPAESAPMDGAPETPVLSRDKMGNMRGNEASQKLPVLSEKGV